MVTRLGHTVVENKVNNSFLDLNFTFFLSLPKEFDNSNLRELACALDLTMSIISNFLIVTHSLLFQLLCLSFQMPLTSMPLSSLVILYILLAEQRLLVPSQWRLRLLYMPRTIIQVQYLVTVSCSSNQLSASNPHMGYFVIDYCKNKTIIIIKGIQHKGWYKSVSQSVFLPHGMTSVII